MLKIYKIKPSMLSKYGIECPHCLWMSMNANWNQKSMNLSMYGTLSRHIENKLQGQPTEKYLPELGKGKVIETGGGVCSGKLPLESSAEFYIAGNFDHLAQLADETYAVIDDKTSSANPVNLLPEKQAETYASQVNAYSYALEKPAKEDWINEIFKGGNHVNSLRMVPKVPREKINVSRLGLNNFAISKVEMTKGEVFKFSTKRVWAEVKKNYQALLDLAQQIADVTVKKSPPPSSPDCSFCKDFDKHQEFRLYAQSHTFERNRL